MKKFPNISGYKFVKEIGRGGMADVYLAIQKKLDRMVAVKILLPEIFRHPVSLKRFLREARTLSKLVHPNIITVYDVGQVDGSYFIVMEYLQDSLKERIKKKGKMAPEEALQLILQIASALYYAHRAGVVHRDVKPDNIMFRKDGVPVILDFGIARFVNSATKLTKTGMSIGTPNYISPEQARGEKVDGRSDIYSLGVVFYEMLTGKIPYQSENTLGVVIKHIQEPIPRLSGKLRKYQFLLDKMMHKDKSKRVRSEKELNEIIKNLLNYDPIRDGAKRNAGDPRFSAGKTYTALSLNDLGAKKPKPGSQIRSSSAKPRVANRAVKQVASKAPSKKKKRGFRRFLVFLLFALLIVLGGLVYHYLNRPPGYQTLDSDDVQGIIKKYNFFDSIWNKYGRSEQHLEKKVLNEQAVLVDDFSGLMWHPGGSDTPLKYEWALRWINDLNRRGYAGFRDWRLPTMKEAAALLRQPADGGKLYISSLFSPRQLYIWTGDKFKSQGAWVVRFDEGYVLNHHFDYSNYVRPVRETR